MSAPKYRVSPAGYRLHVVTYSDYDVTVGPGALYIEEGAWIIRGHTYGAGDALSLYSKTMINGVGLLGAVEVLGVDFESLDDPRPADVIRHAKPWGYELEVMISGPARGRVQLKRLQVDKGGRTSEQYHLQKDEIMCFFDGEGQVTPPNRIDDDGFVHVAPYTIHRVAGPRSYFEASTYFPTDVVRTGDDYGR